MNFFETGSPLLLAAEGPQPDSVFGLYTAGFHGVDCLIGRPCHSGRNCGNEGNGRGLDPGGN
mgnify:CR=1 FL=1